MGHGVAPVPAHLDISLYSESMSVSSLLTISGIPRDSGYLRAYACVAGVCFIRGEELQPSRPPFGPYMGKPLYQIIVYANDQGEQITFTYEDVQTHLTNDIDQTLQFKINGNFGTVLSPIDLTSTQLPWAPPYPPAPPSPELPCPPSPPLRRRRCHHHAVCSGLAASRATYTARHTW